MSTVYNVSVAYIYMCIHKQVWVIRVYTLHMMHSTSTASIINPRRACAARVTVLGLSVCLSVCLSVYAYSRSTGYEAAYERYQQLEGYESMKIKKAIFLKRLRSRDMA